MTATVAAVLAGLAGAGAGLWLGRRQPAAAAAALSPQERCPLGLAHLKERRFVWANPRWAEILGVRPEHLSGTDVRLFHQDAASYEAFGEAAYPVLARGGPYAAEVRLRRVDGSPFWGRLTGSLMVPGQPEAGAIWCLEDVSERIQAQEELADVLALNQKLIASSPTGILLYRVEDGACLMANAAAARILDVSVEEVLGRPFRGNRAWAESGLLAAAEAALGSDTEQRVERRVLTSWERELWLDCHFVPFESRREGLLLMMMGEVTERVRAALALKESQERYRVVVEALNEGLAIVGEDQRYTFCNSRLAAMLGYRLEEVLGQYRTFIIADEDLAFLQAKRAARGRGTSDSFEIRLKKKDGGTLHCLLSVAPVDDAEGRPVAAPVLVTDISERKRVEQEREDLLAELSQKNKELETLVYVASHDLRSPLVNIQGFSQRLGKSLDDLIRKIQGALSLDELRGTALPLLQERMPASLEYIRASGMKMDAIINGLLRLSRAGRMLLRQETLDMNRLLQNAAAATAYQLQMAEGLLEIEDLPACKADPVQVAQVFSNLLDNAIKYRAPERPLRVRVGGSVDGPMVRYWVEDNGLGIPGEHRERIWEIFQRLDPQGATAGEGLGLTLVRRMVERNGGRIWVEAAAGAGCRFVLDLPAG
jgi:PAS domain S-box-containing protein